MMKFVFFSFNQMDEFWENKYPGLISEKTYISTNDGDEYVLFMIKFDFFDQYQQFMEDVLNMGYNIRISPTYPQDEILSTVGESAPLMYIDDTPVDIEVM
uniref:Uncharacterized protein n=1 Tax=Siphoviridae sp. ctBCr48 TaxID=2827802 RepID=A0A8S5SHB0_9CAUD|nr:MAG TPA: hypothetical protein [Siphoviridae sp. ctBCr48]